MAGKHEASPEEAEQIRREREEKMEIQEQQKIVKEAEALNNKENNNNNNNANNNEEWYEKEKDYQNQIALLQKKYDEVDDKYKRELAEFDNYKKRSDKERDFLYGSVKADVFTALLPTVDDLEKAIITETQDEKYKDGIKMILNQFKNVLMANGVEEIKAEPGDKFDPQYHEAVSLVQDPNFGEKEIKEVYRKGYKIGMKILRHSMVVVAN